MYRFLSWSIQFRELIFSQPFSGIAHAFCLFCSSVIIQYKKLNMVSEPYHIRRIFQYDRANWMACLRQNEEIPFAMCRTEWLLWSTIVCLMGRYAYVMVMPLWDARMGNSSLCRYSLLAGAVHPLIGDHTYGEGLRAPQWPHTIATKTLPWTTKSLAPYVACVCR